ncbi:MAG: protein kinase [Planctomycetes bacterium]|nr:protein kinase [Planctomycetota bacterium]
MMLGRYRLLAQHGVGPDGESYQAQVDGGACEVRILAGARAKPERWRQAVKRLKVAAMLEHPVVLRLLEVHFEHDPPFVALEEAPAERLGDAAKKSSWPLEKVLSVARELAACLEAAHRLGLVHGRLGPMTIYWREGKGVRLDFSGVETGNASGQAKLSASTAPELVKGREPDAAADMFALGAVLSWMAGEKRPHGQTSTFHELLAALSAKDPNDRPSAQDVVRELGRILIREAPLASRPLDETQVPSDPGAMAAAAIGVGEADGSPRRLGRFRLLELLGEGGLGKVYRAEDVSDGTVAAVKVLHPSLALRASVVKRFHKEARLLGEIKNPFIANLLENNRDGSIHYLALEFIAGVSLDQILRDPRLCPERRMPEIAAVGMAIDVTRALADPHRRGIIHRDIKPQNVMVLRDSWLFRTLEDAAQGKSVKNRTVPASAGAKLCDFGLARHVVESESLNLTQAGSPIGTPLYMSPEQAAGKDTVGPPTDVYAIGATLFHMLAGQPPFMAETALALSLMHEREAPPSLKKLEPHLSDGICRIVNKCLAKTPAERYADAGELLEELERHFRGEPSSIALHPNLPKPTGKVLVYDWTWDLQAGPEQLWPYVSNTDRLNKAVGIPSVMFRAQIGEKDGALQAPVERFGEFRKAGVTNAWQEHPFEWIEGRRLGVLRQYSRGVFKWLASMTELSALPNGGTRLSHKVLVEPRGFLGRMVAGIEIGFKGRRAVERVYRRIDAFLRGGLDAPAIVDAFETPAQLSASAQRRLDELLDKLRRRDVPGEVLLPLGEFLRQAPDQEAARIRPLALARRLGVDPNQLTAACLHGAREGLLVLLWDILCPLCRIPGDIKETLKSLKDHAHCEACNSDFPVDFANSVELIFRVHPEIRACETRTYCIGGPAHSPHVVAQVRVAPGERLDLDLVLGEGAFRVRGPQLPNSWDFIVDGGALLTRWTLSVPADFIPRHDKQDATLIEPPRLLPGRQKLILHNSHNRELVLRVERMAQRSDALTAARATSLALFRELFPGEILDAGQLVSVAAMTFLVIDLNDASRLERAGNLYAILGEARAFAFLHDYFQLVGDFVRRERGAAVKTVGELVLAVFEDKLAALRAGIALERDLKDELARNWPQVAPGLAPRVGVHRGPAMAATVNGNLDYFGTTVDQALRLPALAGGNELVLTRELAGDPQVGEFLQVERLASDLLEANLPGTAFGVLTRVGFSAKPQAPIRA